LTELSQQLSSLAALELFESSCSRPDVFEDKATALVRKEHSGEHEREEEERKRTLNPTDLAPKLQRLSLEQQARSPSIVQERLTLSANLFGADEE